MSKVTGITSSLTVDDSSGSPQTISDDSTQVTIAIPRGQQDVTGLDKVAVERLGLLYDCTVTVTGVADFASNKEHDVFKADPTGTRTVAVGLAIHGSTASATLTAEMNLQDYTFTRTQAGELTYVATLVNADGNEPQWS